MRKINFFKESNRLTNKQKKSYPSSFPHAGRDSHDRSKSDNDGKFPVKLNRPQHYRVHLEQVERVQRLTKNQISFLVLLVISKFFMMAISRKYLVLQSSFHIKNLKYNYDSTSDKCALHHLVNKKMKNGWDADLDEVVAEFLHSIRHC